FNIDGNDLHPLAEAKTSNSASYPSGHTTYGTVIGVVLAEMASEKRAELLARAADYGMSREVAGVHFPSDVEAGKVLGTIVAADEFATDAAFKAAYPAATACLREAIGLVPLKP